MLLVGISPAAYSLARALADPSLGVTAAARGAEWTRDHGGGWLVVWAENQWFGLNAPPVGGAPAVDAIPAPAAPTLPPASPSAPRALAARAAPVVPAHLPPPTPIQPFASPPIDGEGQWHPVGRPVGGVPAVHEAFLRPDPVHTSLVVGVARMDLKLLSVRLYSGSTIPGAGPWRDTAPITPSAAGSLVAAFNSGFRMPDAAGGYFSEGRTVVPLRDGAASLVIYRNGTAGVAAWGRDAKMSPDVVGVRQNLQLLVDGGSPVAGLADASTSAWGATLGNKVFVWRSGVGVTADGALVYAAGPGLSVPTLADVLARAGAVRAMELDINTDWVNFTSFSPPSPAGPATAADGKNLLSTMLGQPGRYFSSSWSRDFFTVSAR